MKKIILIFSAFSILSCDSSGEKLAKTNGFGPFEGQSVFLGDQSTVDVFMKMDAAWAARDYETLKGMITDGGRYNFEDGTSVSTAQEFVDKIESEYQSSITNQENWGWRTVYAFSVHPKGSDDPAADNQDGQWVNAQFESADATYIEWYHIVDGKLKAWYQAKGNYTFSE
jgi:hypothetical protein